MSRERFRDIPVPTDPYLSTRSAGVSAAVMEEELRIEGGVEQAAQYLLEKYQGHRQRVIQLCRKWVRETGDQRWGLVADHVEGLPPSCADARD